MNVSHYLRYVARVEKRRSLLQQKLQQANALRQEVHLPVRNVDQTVTDTEPLLTQQEFDARAKAQAGFNTFRQQKLASMELPQPDEVTDWEDHRARAFRRSFLEHQIQKVWNDRDHDQS